MELPGWVIEGIRQFKPPTETGKVTIVLKRYRGGITELEIGGSVTLKPAE